MAGQTCQCLLAYAPHKRTVLSFAFQHRRRQTFPLLCRPLSFSLLYPSPPQAQEGLAHTLTPQQTRRSSDHTQSSTRILPPASPLWLTLYRSYFGLPPSDGPHLLSVQPGWGGGNVACPLFHIFLLRSCTVFCLCVCLNVLMWTVERMVT